MSASVPTSETFSVLAHGEYPIIELANACAYFDQMLDDNIWMRGAVRSDGAIGNTFIHQSEGPDCVMLRTDFSTRYYQES
jgi:hypothetical protein